MSDLDDLAFAREEAKQIISDDREYMYRMGLIFLADVTGTWYGPDRLHDFYGWHGGQLENVAACPTCRVNIALGYMEVPKGERPIFDGRRTHRALPPEHLVTACGLDVKGHWSLVDGRSVDCPLCKEAP